MYCISISHKTTPLEIREQFAFSQEEKIKFEQTVLRNKEIHGCIIVTTCNRSEIYFTGEKNALQLMEKELSFQKKINHREMLKYILVYEEEMAVRHLFRVACGLDSMVLGEDEILRQVKEAYQISLEHQTTNQECNLIFQAAIRCAKEIKTDTIFSTTPVSIGTLTANYIEQFLKKNSGKKVLIVGITGKMGSIIAKNLCSKEIHVMGTIRKHNSQYLFLESHPSIQLVDYHERYQYINEVDVIVSATKSPHYVFTLDKIQKHLRKYSNKLFIDLSVPRDIDREIGTFEGIQLLDIDHFQALSRDNNLIKLKEIDKVTCILEKRMDETLKTVYFGLFYPMLSNLKKQIDQKGIESLLYYMKENLSSEHLKAVLNVFGEFERIGD